MRKEYDFSKARPNPYAGKPKKQITIRIDEETVEFFKKRAEETGISYQNLINLYLRDCAAKSKHLSVSWN
ncbi:MAG: BrnA antitoxin family protein [Treponema sp.]|nr:BrnA antitoxin family protein [Treponema sp.]